MRCSGNFIFCSDLRKFQFCLDSRKLQFLFIWDQNIMRQQICFQVPDLGNMFFSRFTFSIVAAVHDRLSWLRPCWSEAETTPGGLASGEDGALVLVRPVEEPGRPCWSGRRRRAAARAAALQPTSSVSILFWFAFSRSIRSLAYCTVLPTYFAVKKMN
jgi:hypothetical protein